MTLSSLLSLMLKKPSHSFREWFSLICKYLLCILYLHRYVIWSSTLLYRSFALPSSLSSLHLRPSSLKMVLKILTLTYCTSFPANLKKQNKSIQGTSSFFNIQPHIHVSLSLFPLSPLSSLYTRCQVLLTF